jgi:acyl-CoA thioesterase FadM
MTETAPFAICANAHEVKSGHIGLPAPGVELKLVPIGDKHEVRYRGPNVTPGYWRAPEQTAEHFDDEGFYCSGDAAKPMDPARPEIGFAFDGRIAEDFKLSTGTFVSVGPLRAKIVAAGDPLVQDVVIAGINRDDIGILLFPRPDACRAFADAPADARLDVGARRRARAHVLPAPRRRPLVDRHRQRDARRARARPRRAAVDRPRRNHRQGLDQPARGADASRRRRRAVVRRRQRRRPRAARRLRSAMPRTTHYRVRIEFGDCDPAGIVFYPNFQRWIDAASLSFFIQCGVPPWRELVKTRGIVGTPLLEISTRFVTAATYAEELTIATHVAEWRAKVFIQHHRVTRGDTLICEGRETRAFVRRDPDDPDRLRAIPIPDDIRALCE